MIDQSPTVVERLKSEHKPSARLQHGCRREFLSIAIGRMCGRAVGYRRKNSSMIASCAGSMSAGAWPIFGTYSALAACLARRESAITNIDYFPAPLVARVCDFWGAPESSDRLLAGLYRFIDFDSLEQTQDPFGFISACFAVENPSVRIDNFPEVFGFLDCEMF